MTKPTRRTIALVLGIMALQALTIGGVIALGAYAYQQSENYVASEAARASDAEERAEEIDALREQVLELGEDPVVDPVPTAPSDPGERARDGVDGKDGRDGEDASPAQIAAAVAEYCAANGGCIGAQGNPGLNGTDGTDGTDGVDGAPGADSTTPGPAGPPGPLCPDSFTPKLVWVEIADADTGPTTRVQAIVCTPTPTPEGETP